MCNAANSTVQFISCFFILNIYIALCSCLLLLHHTYPVRITVIVEPNSTLRTSELIQLRYQPSSALPHPPFTRNKEERKVANKHHTPASLLQAEDGATWSLWTDIKESQDGC